MDFGGLAIAQLDQDQLRWGPVQDGELAEVVVLGRQDEPLFGGLSPDQGIVGPGQLQITHMGGAGKMGGQSGGQQRGQVLVEQQPHAARGEKVRRSRSAAKAKQARMSSWVSAGNSARSSDSGVPAAGLG